MDSSWRRFWTTPPASSDGRDLDWECYGPAHSPCKKSGNSNRVQISFVMSDKTSTQTEAAYITPSTRIQSKHMAAYNCLHMRKNPNTECFSL